jgi:SanA protein
MSNIKRRLQKMLWTFILSIISVLIITIWSNHTIKEASKNYITDNINDVETNKVGLLLGTSKLLKGGYKNEYFFNRIDATVELYKKGKIHNVLISGDHGTQNYNEPLDMKKELIKNGIPDSVIYLDYAGFRTLDAVVRANAIFGQSSFLIISQKFHNERAIFLAQKNGLNAYGYNAKDVSYGYGLSTNIREYFARVKVFLDLLFGIKPKFLGEKIVIK